MRDSAGYIHHWIGSTINRDRLPGDTGHAPPHGGPSTMTTFSWDRKCLLFTNHALVLGVIAADPAVRIRDIAERVEITERAVEILLRDLIQVGFLTRKRVGRRNVYEVHRHEKLRHPLIDERDVGGVVRAMLPVKKQQ